MEIQKILLTQKNRCISDSAVYGDGVSVFRFFRELPRKTHRRKEWSPNCEYLYVSRCDPNFDNLVPEEIQKKYNNVLHLLIRVETPKGQLGGLYDTKVYILEKESINSNGDDVYDNNKN